MNDAMLHAVARLGTISHTAARFGSVSFVTVVDSSAGTVPRDIIQLIDRQKGRCPRIIGLYEGRSERSTGGFIEQISGRSFGTFSAIDSRMTYIIVNGKRIIVRN